MRDQTNLQRQMQGLRNHLREEGLHHEVVPGLGDCQFESFSRGLFWHRGLSISAESLRQESVDWLATQIRHDEDLKKEYYHPFARAF